MRGFGTTVDATYKAGSLVSYRVQTQDSFGNTLSNFDCQELPGIFCPQVPFDNIMTGITCPSKNGVELRASRFFQNDFPFYLFTPTVAGTYDLQVRLMRQHSVQMRSFRPFESFNNALDIASSFKTDISTRSEACLTSTSFHFSGFLFPEKSGTVKFQLKAAILAQFYIERQLITSVSGGNSAEAQGEIYLTSERPYLFSMQTQACSSGHKPAEIFWRFDSDTPFRPIPPSHIFYKADDLSNSRFRIKIKPAQFCSSCSQAEGDGLTLAVASVPASFRIFAKDQYCNTILILDQESFVIRILRDGSAVQFIDVGASQVNGQSAVQYTTEYVQGIYDLHVSHLFPGLMATYYHDFSNQSTVDYVSSIDFSGSSAPSDFVNASYSVRWCGFIKSVSAQLYTMYSAVAEADERMKLWVDSKLLVDQWKSLESTEASGMIAFGRAAGYYMVVMEYKQSKGQMAANLKWASQDAPKSIIPSKNFFVLSDIHHSLLRTIPIWDKSSVTEELSVRGGSSITVFGVGFNTSQIYTCLFTGRDFSAAMPVTAFNTSAIVCHTPPCYGYGSKVDFTVQVKGSIFSGTPNWPTLTTQFQLKGLLLSIKPRKSNAAGFANITISSLGLGSQVARKCSFQGSYEHFEARQAMIKNSSTVPFLGTAIAACFTPLWDPLKRITNGLAATYYMGSNLSVPLLSAISFEVDFSKAFGSSLMPTSATAGIQLTTSVASGSMSIRWSGFIQPEFAVTYTIKVRVHDIDERVKIWIDNALIVDQWTSLKSNEGSATWGFANVNSFYDVRVEYQQHTGSMGLQLLWKKEEDSFFLVKSERLFLPSPGWGHTSMSIREGVNGVYATYYDSPSFESALFTKVDDSISVIDSRSQQLFDISPSRPIYAVRWSGFVEPSCSQTYSMYTKLARSDQRVKLWIDNQLVVDQWSSLSGTKVYGTIVFGDAYSYYRILMEYKQFGPAPAGPIEASLCWKSGSEPVTVVPSRSLFLSPKSKPQDTHITLGSSRFTFSGLLPTPITRCSKSTLIFLMILYVSYIWQHRYGHRRLSYVAIDMRHRRS